MDGEEQEEVEAAQQGLCLVLTASWTGFDEFLDVLLQGGPPETLQEGMPCPLNTGVTGELGGVGP